MMACRGIMLRRRNIVCDYLRFQFLGLEGLPNHQTSRSLHQLPTFSKRPVDCSTSGIFKEDKAYNGITKLTHGNKRADFTSPVGFRILLQHRSYASTLTPKQPPNLRNDDMSREKWAKKLVHWKNEFKSTLLKLAGGKSILSTRERQQLTRTSVDVFGPILTILPFIIAAFMSFLRMTVPARDGKITGYSSHNDPNSNDKLINPSESLIDKYGYSPDDLTSEDKLMNLFELWMIKYEKKYESIEEKMYRFEIFKDDLKYIPEGSKDLFGPVGLNQYSDLTSEEFPRGLLDLSELPPELRELVESCAQTIPQELLDLIESRGKTSPTSPPSS